MRERIGVIPFSVQFFPFSDVTQRQSRLSFMGKNEHRKDYAKSISLTSMATLDNYVCIACRLVEGYITDSTNIKDVVKNMDKVEPDIEGEMSC